ncbi:dynein axonemal assembly factor 5 [Toxorhynchites rutilus septentrionalis]|uniref:dynein axonemal assembly factor 5 n=1 Tax=Toxorhynchites rutilus septentrionalis TaxID=329112 RepID=UPI00247AC185|nr:dynein axonemal assembly factor 5 [Toxorhynchites rutilus septentrionalis]
MSDDKNKTFVELFCVNIRSTDRGTRQNVLNQFIKVMESQLAADVVDAIFRKTYAHILRCYDDRFEIIRSLAITVMGELLDKLPAKDCYLDYIVPIITRRIGGAKTLEDSEEVRLQLLEQLDVLINKYEDPENIRGNPLHRAYDNIIDILANTLTDPFPAAQKLSCDMVHRLALATHSMHFRVEALVAPAITVLKHRHSANRAAGVETLGILALYISSSSESMTRIFMEISPLLMDSVPFVRRSCGRVGCMLLLRLKDRYSFFPRILPLVLCCLDDDNEEVCGDIEARWEEVGEQYYLENETELSKIKLIDKIPSNYPEEYERPTIACRAIVQRSLVMVGTVLKEMEEWKEGIRLHSLKLFKMILIHAEKSLSPMFVEVYAVLCRICKDRDKAIVAEAIEVVKMCSVLLEYSTWSKHVQTEFMKSHSEWHLKSLIAMYSSADSERLKDLSEILKLLASHEVSHKLIESCRYELVMFCQVLIEDYHCVYTSSNNDVDASAALRDEALLYTILVKIVAFTCEDSTESRNHVMNVLTQLNPSVEILHERHMKGIIAAVDNLEMLDAAETIILLAGIVSGFGFWKSYHAPLKSALGAALVHTMPQGRIKLFSAISSGMLQWRATMQIPPEEQYLLMRDFVDDILTPYMHWEAGQTAESVRSMATTCLYSMTQGAEQPICTKLVESFIKIIEGLSEDSSVTTRSYALGILLSMGPTHCSVLKKAAQISIARLDDPSVDIRELAAKCLGCLQLSPMNEDDNFRWETILRQMLPTMFLHLENPEEKLRVTILASIERLAVHHRALIGDISNEVAVGTPYKAKLDHILARRE